MLTPLRNRMPNQEIFADPAWKAQRASSDNQVLVTPCEPIEIRLLDVRIPWEPSSFVEDNDRKNVFFELKNPDVLALLQHLEDTLAEEGGLVNSCMAKEGLVRCKISMKQVHVFDKDRYAAEVRRLDLQCSGETDRQMANAGRRRVGLESAGNRYPVAQALSARVPILVARASIEAKYALRNISKIARVLTSRAGRQKEKKR